MANLVTRPMLLNRIAREATMNVVGGVPSFYCSRCGDLLVMADSTPFHMGWWRCDDADCDARSFVPDLSKSGDERYLLDGEYLEPAQDLRPTKPDKIILFGSAATGQMTRDSDVDLLIVEPDTSKQRDEYTRVSGALRDLPYPFDVLFINTQWFEESKDIVGGIAYPAHKYGKVIYDAA